MAARSRIDWRRCAAKLEVALPLERLYPSVVAWAERCPKAERWVVAFSGGADSLALLLALWSHWPERRRTLSAVHFNHCLRGIDAKVDERFCRQVCSALGVRFASARWAEASATASEAEARAARHAFFDRQLRQWRARALWFGHQLDDVAETMVMRIARGSGLGGLAAPRPIQRMPDQRVHLRPMLALGKVELVAILQECGIPWREDRSNTENRFFRNRIRHEVIPAWQAACGGRDALAGAGLSRELIDEDDRALEAWVAEVAPIARDGSLNLKRLAGKPRGFLRRALRLWLTRQEIGLRISRQAFNAVVNDLEAHRVTRHSLDQFHFIVIGKSFARITRVPRKISN